MEVAEKVCEARDVDIAVVDREIAGLVTIVAERFAARVVPMRQALQVPPERAMTRLLKAIFDGSMIIDTEFSICPFEGEVDIYEKKTGKDSEKFLRIKKLYNQRYLEREMLLEKERLQQ